MKNIDTRNLIIFALLVVIALLFAYANHFDNTFHFDDAHTVVDNVSIRNLKNIPRYFTDPKMFSSDPQHWGLRPLVTTTLAIDYALGNGLNPYYFQLSTFIWHILLCALLYFIYKKLLDFSPGPWTGYIAAIAAAWFALHTANAETLNYVISRSDVLSTFFILLSFGIYLFWPAKRKFFIYLIPAIVGGFAKETVPVLPVILFFYKLIIEEGVSLTEIYKKTNLKKAFSVFLSLLPLTLAILAVQLYTLSKVSSIPGISNPWLPYVLTQTYVWLHYFISFFLPANLSADTDWVVINNPFDERIILGIVFFISLCMTIIKTSKTPSMRPVSLGLIWFAASLLPTSLVPFAEVTNDHRMYFAFTGLSLSVVTYLSILIKKWKWNISPLFRYGLAISLILLLGLNVYGVRSRNRIWKTEESLWYDVTLKSPNNGRGLMNYGLTQMAVGKYEVAESYFTKAVQFLPNYYTLYINLGVLNGAKHNDQAAEKYFMQAIALQPNAFEPHTFYARFLMERGRYAEAEVQGEKALLISPISQMALNILMETSNLTQNWSKMQHYASQLLSLLPDDEKAKFYLKAAKTRTQLIVKTAAVNTGKATTAADHLNNSLQYYNAGEYQKCIDACLSALELNPNYDDAYSNLGAAYNQLGQWQKGIDACRKALAINPRHKLAKGNLDWALNSQKKQRK